MYRLGTAIVLLTPLLGSCTGPEPRYCDESTSCESGFRCDLERRRCMPEADGGRDTEDDLLRSDTIGLPNGQACNDPAQCRSTFCVDGVCCDAACDGTCRTCALSGQEGTCSLVPEGADPRQDCIGTDSICGGSCDGQGACAFPGSSTTCAAPVCSAGMLTTHACDGGGGCPEDVQTCGGYTCASGGDACRTHCGDIEDCTGTFECINGSCVNQLPNGAACGSNDNACASKLCVDGVCCDTACTGPCQACNQAGMEGTCVDRPDGVPCAPASCTDDTLTAQSCSAGTCTPSSTPCGLYRCNSQGNACLTACGDHTDCVTTAYCAATLCATRKEDGATCDTDVECTSDICQIDEKICCDTPCTEGPCQSCNLAGTEGTCSFSPAGTPCGAPEICVNEPLTSYIEKQQCSGSSPGCQTVKTLSCDPYRCASAGAQCATSCDSHADCSTGLCDLAPDFGSFKACVPQGALCYVDQAQTCPGTGAGSQTDPYCKIQACIDSVRPYTAVADGTYHESLSISSDIQIISTGTTGALMSNGLPQANVAKVALLAQGSTPAITIDGASPQVRIHGLDITHAGTAGGSPLVSITASSAQVLLQTTAVHDCTGLDPGILASGSGTSPSLALSDLAVTSCEIGVQAIGVDLIADRVGVGGTKSYGIYHSGGMLRINNTLVAFNQGTGIRTSNSQVTMNAVKIGANNQGLRLENQSDGTFTNLQINDNLNGGILVVNTLGPLVFVNATIANNGGPMVECEAANAQFFNGILWSPVHSNTYSGSCSFSYSDVKLSSGVVPGTGNINQAPQFDTAHSLHPYRLLSSSPCVDAGTDTDVGVTLPGQDLAGNPRQVDKIPGGAMIDMGAFEVQ